jgi:hypothetical protein
VPLTQRDIFESQYILKHMVAEPYQESKRALESLRFELTYLEGHLAECYEWWVKGVEFEDMYGDRIAELLE